MTQPTTTDGSEIAAVARAVIATCAERRLTIGVAESLTGGLLVAELIRVPGASAVIRGGIVAYATPLKHRLLGVDPGLLAVHGAVHPDVALQMAAGVRTAVSIDGLPADIGIATTGVAGPDEQDGCAVGTVFIGIVTKSGPRVIALELSGGREAIQQATVEAAVRALAVEISAEGGPAF